MKIMLYGSPVQILAPGLAERMGDGVEIVSADYSTPLHDLTRTLDDCAAIVTVRYDANLLTASKTLRLVQVPGVGYDEIMLEALPAQTTLCNVRGHGPAVSEYVIGALLMRTERLQEADGSFRAGSWMRSSRMGGLPHGELAGKRIGIVGYGLIGQAIAQRLKPFEVHLQVCNRSPVETGDLVGRVWPIDQLAEMASGCDILIVTVALNPETVGLIGAEAIGAMPKGGVLVNVARGPIVDEDALFEGLSSGHLGGAVLDVWYSYPADANDLDARASRYDFSQFPGVVMTPHISGWSEGTLRRRLDDMAENLKRLQQGLPLLNVVREPQ